jgi:meso-butanediol dehydrogenase/(S,S)-butanediol dehydrogenase/diacetyl reductase
MKILIVKTEGVRHLENEGKRVVITGGTSGIGKEATKMFAENGYSVVFTGRSTDKADALLLELTSIGLENVYFFQADMSKEEDVAKLYEFTNKTIGGCDVLVNNAGLFIGGLVHETKIEDWNRLFDTNVKAIYLTSKYFIPEMIRSNSGAIVNTSSISGLSGEYNMTAYCATKGAVSNLTRAMALDYADKGIRVNAVCPGATDTPMFMTGATEEVINSFSKVFPPGRVGKAKEVAEAIFFLASEKASFINGVNLPVEGGLTAHSGQPKQEKNQLSGGIVL